MTSVFGKVDSRINCQKLDIMKCCFSFSLADVWFYVAGSASLLCRTKQFQR